MYFFVRLSGAGTTIEAGAPVSIDITNRLLEIGTVKNVKNKKDGLYLTVQAYMPTSVDTSTLERLEFNRKGVRELRPGEYDTFV
jgi:hypothetical protein